MSDFSGWVKVKLGDLTEGFRGVSYQPTDLMDSYTDESVVLLRANNIQNGKLLLNDIQIVPKRIVKSFQYLATDDIAVCMSNGSKHLVGKSAQFSSNNHLVCTVGAFCSIFRTRKEAEPAFVKQLFHSPAYQAHIDFSLSGSAINNLKNSDIESIIFNVPPKAKQQKIATILTSIDTAIEKTEALIEKYQQIKSGLMHDLFTRGVLPNGQLRPTREQAPELYQETKIGWIPKGWGVTGLRERSRLGTNFIRTGPFGSALKGEHWVTAGHPVITIGALGEGEFIESELLFVGERDARRLIDFQLKPGDVVFSRVADVGRSVVIRDAQAGWIMSSNLMRIAVNEKELLPELVQLSLAFDHRLKSQIKSKVNSGGRDVANSEVLNQLRFIFPSINEQEQIVSKFNVIRLLIQNEQQKRAKLFHQKLGLMQDLLTGKVPVTVSENADQEEAHA